MDNSPSKPPFNIYIECSTTFYLGLNTGIQRVVRNIIRRAPLTGLKKNIHCIPVVTKYGRLWESEKFNKLQASAELTSSTLRAGSRLSVKLAEHEKRIIQKSKQIRPIIIYAYGISFIRRLVRYIGYTILQVPFVFDIIFGRAKAIKPRDCDILLMPDAFWAYNVDKPLSKNQYKNMYIIPLIHDLIPLTHSHYFERPLIKVFERSLKSILNQSSAVISISHSTKESLHTFLDNQGMKRELNIPSVVCYSGADLLVESSERLNELSIRSEINHINNGKIFLMVGTIEPRKGYEVAFSAFTKLWNQGYEGTLVIIGRIGWKCAALIDEMLNSRYAGRLLFVFSDANDKELDYLYKNSSALISASRIEGFGLPLVEAMQYQLPVIASDIPVFKEVAEGYAEFFRVGDADDLMKKVQNFPHNAHQSRRPVRNTWRTWDEATIDLINICTDLRERLRGT